VLNALSVHLKQKWFKETFKRIQIEWDSGTSGDCSKLTGQRKRMAFCQLL